MDFKFSEKEEKFREEVRDFLRKELTGEFQDKLIAKLPEHSMVCKEFTEKLAQKGWIGIGWPKEYGGQGRTYMEQVVYAEEIGYHRAPTWYNKLAYDIVAPLLIKVANEEQKGKYLQRIASGQISFCLGYTEPDTGCDLASLNTRATYDGNVYVINGHKMLISCAEWADYCLLAARTDPNVPKHRGISLFIVDMKSPGITVKHIPAICEMPIGEILLDDVRLSRASLLGEENRGWEYLMLALNIERVVIAGVVAMLQGSYDVLLEYVRSTTRCGRPLREDPMVRNILAQLYTELEVARLLCYRTICIMEKGEIPTHEASMAKVFCTELERRLTNVGTQIMGLAGQLMGESKWAPLHGRIASEYRFSLVSGVGGGTNELQRTLIAQIGLGLPR